MAIKGRLQDLQAAEILQFLAHCGRSGTLRVFDDHRSKLLCFEDGDLTYAVSQHELPPLKEVLYQHGIINDPSLDRQVSVRCWSDQVTKALAWRRVTGGSRVAGEHYQARLGEILVRRGKISQQDLDFALEPEDMPDDVLEEILITGYGIGRTAVQGIRKIATPDVSLYEALTSAKALTREQILEEVAGISEDLLLDLLVYYGYVKRSDANFSAEQLKAMRGHFPPIIRIGELLVASGRATQRQLDKALEAQLAEQKPLGQILVDHGVVPQEFVDDAVWELDDLRAAFSPLYSLFELLTQEHGFSLEDFTQARDKHMASAETLEKILVDTGKITTDKLCEVVEKILSDELFDLMLWQEGSYEFFEGFSLEDALAETGLDRIHGFTFDVGCLLLDAAYQADELRRSDSEYICPNTILEKQDLADPESTEPKITDFEHRLLHRMDGKRPRRDVCSVLPGNSLSHGRMLARFVANGWARPLLRTEAYNKGQVCVERGNHKQAVRYFEHALAASGDQPTDATLRLAIQAARAAISKSPVQYAAFGINKAVRFVTDLPIVQVPVQALGRMKSVARPARWVKDKWSQLRAAVSQSLNRWILAFEEFMIQKGLAGQWWAVRTHVVTPVRRVGTALTTRFTTATLASVAVLMILVVAGITDSGTERRKPALGGSSMPGFPPAEVRSAVAEVDAGGPFEVSPTVAGSAIYMASRDGTLRSMPLSNLGNRASFRWQVEIGKYGDLLSRPVVFGNKVFVTNVRGSVHAVSTAGKPLWTTKFPRVEKIAPSVIASSKPGLEPAGLVIVARDTVSVLDPENGDVLYQLRTGNMIIAPPAVNKDRIYVGGVDDHIYCADWRAGEIVWDTEVADDVMSLTLAGDHLVALIRGGTVIDLRAGDGEVSWQKDIVGSPVNRVEVLSGKRISLEMAQGELQICSLEDGKKLSSITPKAALGVTSLRAVGDRFIYVSRRGYIGQLNDKGAHLWCCENKLGQITGWTLLKNRLAVTNVAGELWFFDLSRETSDGK